MNILITICARGGSKGVPNKNIKKLDGHYLLNSSIKHAREFLKNKEGVISLSTESESIAKIATDYGLETEYRRPKELADDKSEKIPVIYDLLKYEECRLNLKFDYILDLDVSSPLRTIEDLDKAFHLIKKDNKALNLFSVSPAHKNPYFNMVEKNKSSYYELCKKGEFLSRQTAPKVFELNASFYFYRRSFFNNQYNTVMTPATLIYCLPHICFDIDEPIDFEFMEFLIKNDRLGFKI